MCVLWYILLVRSSLDPTLWGKFVCGPLQLIVGLRNRTGEERRQQTLSDKRDNNFV